MVLSFSKIHTGQVNDFLKVSLNGEHLQKHGFFSGYTDVQIMN